jgi:PAS domain S-box-containing protein
MPAAGRDAVGLRPAQGLSETEALRLLAAHTTDVVWLLGEAFEVWYATPSLRAQMGLEPEAVRGRDYRTLLTALGRTAWDRLEEGLRGDGGPWQVDLEHGHGEGYPVWFEAQIARIPGAAADGVRFVVSARNVNRRKQTENELQLANALFQTAFAISPDSVNLNRLRDGRYVMVNEGFTALTGFTPEEVIGKTTAELGIWATIEDLRRLVQELNSVGSVKNLEARFRLKNGEVKTGLISANVIILNREPYILSITKDIEDWKRAETALKESEEKYRLLVENANDAIFILQDGQLKFPNRRAREMGRTMGVDLAHHSFFEYVAPEDQNMILERHFRRLRGEDVPSTYSFRLLNSDGRKFWVEVNAVRIKWDGRPATLNFLRDIDSQKSLEVQFQHARKMETVGTLAGAIAHNFNNLLMAIQGNVSLMLLDTAPDSPQHPELKKIQEHVESGARMTAQLLGYARKGKYRIRSLDVNELVAETVASFGKTQPNVAFNVRFDKRLRPVVADRSQLEQVLTNVFINAADAMPRGGQVIVRTRNVGYEQVKRGNYEVKPGEYVLVRVADTGMGMEAKVRRRIFEPFFTTKELGRGTGLGLASAYGIVKGHGGYIEVESRTGKGTTVYIYLPASATPVESVLSRDEGILKGSGCVLVVDDEPVVLAISARMLKKVGYTVIEADGGREAVRLYRKYEKSIDLVLLDMIMPDMGGAEVFNRLKDINPQVRVVLATGYTLEGQAGDLVQGGCIGVIQKPFTLEVLSRQVAYAIGQRREPAAGNARPPGDPAP